MELSQAVKERILEGIKAHRPYFDSDSKHAKHLGIASSVYTALKQGNIERQLSEGKWMSIAQNLGISLRPEQAWKAVVTHTYEYITEQLGACQEQSICGLLCDIPNIGKTFTAKLYAKTHKNVVYIDCSQCKTKREFIRQLIKGFGVDTSGTYYEMYQRLKEFIVGVDKPLIILDEAGDLQHEAFVEVKALWNATEHYCGWYMMGAIGLKVKLQRLIDCDKVGYAEIFNRLGNNYRRITGETEEERQKLILTQCIQVAQANAPEGVDYKALARRAGGLRRVYTEIMKARRYGTA